MRKETRLAAEAFLGYRSYVLKEYRGHPPIFTGARTDVRNGQMELHGNLIAWHNNGDLVFCLRGHITNTTIDRLNGILELAHGRRPFFRRKGKAYFGTLAREVGPKEFFRVPRYVPEEVTDGAAA